MVLFHFLNFSSQEENTTLDYATLHQAGSESVYKECGSATLSEANADPEKTCYLSLNADVEKPI